MRIGATDLLRLLRLAGHDVPEEVAEVTFKTPGGGDWSNMDVALMSDADSGEQVVTVTWKTRRTR